MVFAADEPKPATGGEVTLLVNGAPVASGRMEHTVPARFSGYAGMDIGCDNGLVVDRSYGQGALPVHGRDQAGDLRHRSPHERGGQAGASRARSAGARGARSERLARPGHNEEAVP